MTRALVWFCCAWAVVAQPFDMVLLNGRIIDGTGQPARPGSVAIRDGRVVAPGEYGCPELVDGRLGHVAAPQRSVGLVPNQLLQTLVRSATPVAG